MEPLGGEACEGFTSAISYAPSCLKVNKLQLKSKQVEAIRVVYERREWLPTGYGKSICFQVLPYVFDFKLGRSCMRSTSHDRYDRKVALYNSK